MQVPGPYPAVQPKPVCSGDLHNHLAYEWKRQQMEKHEFSGHI